MNEQPSARGMDEQAPPRVLVLEDHADTLDVVGRLLCHLGVDVVPTATCADARSAARTLGRFDVVIADAWLDDGNGVELAAELKAAHGCAVLILSALEPPTERMPAWVDCWLAKPVGVLQLEPAIRALTRP